MLNGVGLGIERSFATTSRSLGWRLGHGDAVDSATAFTFGNVLFETVLVECVAGNESRQNARLFDVESGKSRWSVRP